MGGCFQILSHLHIGFRWIQSLVHLNHRIVNTRTRQWIRSVSSRQSLTLLA
jgi:hypothetical protein